MENSARQTSQELKNNAKRCARNLFERLKIWRCDSGNPAETGNSRCWYADYTLDPTRLNGLKRARVVWLEEKGQDPVPIDIDDEKEFDTIPCETWIDLYEESFETFGISR